MYHTINQFIVECREYRHSISYDSAYRTINVVSPIPVHLVDFIGLTLSPTDNMLVRQACDGRMNDNAMWIRQDILDAIALNGG